MSTVIVTYDFTDYNTQGRAASVATTVRQKSAKYSVERNKRTSFVFDLGVGRAIFFSFWRKIKGFIFFYL